MRSTHDAVIDKPENSKPKMTVGEALQVPWLRHRPKPLGDLMEEGYLDDSRLEWAASKAFDPRLRQAAQVLLHARAEVLAREGDERVTKPGSPKRGQLGMRLQEAEAVQWPFGEFKGQAMGPLVRSRRLSLKDLAHAIENAWDDRVRRAAIALSLVRLDQAIEDTPSAGGPLNIVRRRERSYAQRRLLQFATWQGAIGGGVIGMVFMLFVNLVRPSASSPSPRVTIGEVVQTPEGVIAVVLVLLGALVIYFALTRGFNWAWDRLERQIDAYRKGEAGEEAVIEKARRALDGNWTLFRNIFLPGKKADLDIVLVGPPGVWAVEVKTLSGIFRNYGDSWQVRSGKRWSATTKNPSRQARNGALKLKDFLRAEGIGVFVHDAVAWAEQGATVDVDNPMVAVWAYERLEDELSNLTSAKPLPEADRARIAEKLIKVCQPSGG